MNYSKPIICLEGSAISIVGSQSVLTKLFAIFADIIPPCIGLTDQCVTPAAYEADE
jgi:hypothetical protein